MPTPTLKITYFQSRGRAEPLRLACVLGDLPFTDYRFPLSELSTVKATAPYSAVPTVEIDGITHAQSAALLRYLGKFASLYPDCDLTALHVDEIVDAMEDFAQDCFRYRGEDKELLRKARESFSETSISRYAGGVEKRLEAMGDGPWAVGDAISIADLVIANTVNNFKSGFLEFVDPDALDGFPRIMASHRAVLSHPKIIEWYEKHPIPNVPVPLTE